MKAVIRFVAAAAFACACGSHTQSTPVVTAPPPTQVEPPGGDTAPETAAEAPEPPDLRLPRLVVPTSYTARLRIDPADEEFTGQIDIEADILEPTELFWLNQSGLAITTASLSTGGQTYAMEVIPVEDDYVGFRLPREVAPGTASLSIAYSGKVPTKEYEGVFRQQEGDHWYVFTQFEATSARNAFPCFDEPDVKVPWQLTLEVPSGDAAYSNTPITDEQIDNGAKVVRFARTKPLPSYLLAFAVGPFEAVDAGKTRTGVPIRIISPKGRTAETRYAVESTGPLLALLEDYFGMPYPYEKLDMIAIPEFFGAMENPGLITYAASLLLVKDEENTLQHQRRFATVAAHELAHQWFGDYVTMKWWDDIWLNEAFATWMEAKIVDQWQPKWDGAVSIVGRKSGSMEGDSLDKARKVRQPIESADDISNAFDGITYGKGASVIRMFELWVGPDVFQKGVRAYMTKYAWKNAGADQFLAEIATAAGGKDVATPMSTFLDQVGVPLVTVELDCAKGAVPKLKLAQSRYLPSASKAKAAGQLWQIPMCVKYAAGAQTAKVARLCTVMTELTMELELPEAKTCPAWVLPNEGEIGYYRFEPKGDLLARLLGAGQKKLTLPERVGLIGDVEALVSAGKLPAGDALALVDKLAKDKSRHIIGASIGIVAGAKEIIPDELRPNYARFVRKIYGARAAQLGFAPRKGAAGEEDEIKLLRPQLVGLVAGDGEDKKLIAEATRLTWAWIDDHKAVSPDMVGLVLHIAAANGDRKLYDRLYAEAKQTTDENKNDREHYLDAIGSFTDPAIAKDALALVLGDDFDVREVMGILFGMLRNPRTRIMAYDFVKANYDAILAKMPKRFAGYLVYTGVALCDASKRKEVEEFFGTRAAQVEGGPRLVAQALEQMDLCIAQREEQRPSIVAFLKKY